MVALGGAVCVVLGVALLAVLVQWRTGVRNPAGTTISRPPLRQIVADVRHEPTLDDRGRFLALTTAAAPLRVDVMDPVTGEVFDRVAVDPVAVPRETSRALGWDEVGRLWVIVSGHAGNACLRIMVFETDDRRFHAAPCADLPPDVLARANGRMPPRSDPLPAGAQLPEEEAFFVPRLSLDGSRYAVDVDEREYRDLAGRRFKITDARLLDRFGGFVAQLGYVEPVGWAHDGSLVVYHPHDRRLDTYQWDVSLIAAADLP